MEGDVYADRTEMERKRKGNPKNRREGEKETQNGEI